MTDYANLREQLSGQWANNPISNIELGCKATLLSQPERDTILSALETASKPEADTITTLCAEVAKLQEGLAIMEPVLRERASLARTARTIAGPDGLTTADKKAIVAHQIARALLETNHAK